MQLIPIELQMQITLECLFDISVENVSEEEMCLQNFLIQQNEFCTTSNCDVNLTKIMTAEGNLSGDTFYILWLPLLHLETKSTLERNGIRSQFSAPVVYLGVLAFAFPPYVVEITP